MESWRRPDPELLPIHRPHCPKCQMRMITARVSGQVMGCENRMFRCAKCGHSETRMLASEPLQSDVLRRLKSELQPPKTPIR
jgi:tRNA(Ile2) C34 agmatinyltransferase TiaS